MNVPLNQRSHNLFLSHSSRDKQGFVDALYQFLTKHAALKVWYDRGLTSGQVSSKLDTAIESCRAAIIVISENSSNSHWVELECSRLMEEAARMREFRIATVRLDPVDPPGLLKSFKHIDAPDGAFSYDAAALLFETLYGGREITGGRPVYLSRGWRTSEAKAADKISEAGQSFGFKLVSDWTDQPDYDVERVRALMDGCGGLIAILPHRGQGETSRYILREIQVARELGIPVLVFAHADVVIDSALRIDAIRYDDGIGGEKAGDIAERFSGRFEDLTELWKKPGGGEHVFFGHSLEASVGDSFMTIRRMLSRLTGLPVVVGGEVVAKDAQDEIVRLIRESELSVIDITNVAHPGIPDKIDFGHRGIGSALFERLIIHALGLGYTRLYVTTHPENEAMKALARKFEARLTFEAGEAVGVIQLPETLPQFVPVWPGTESIVPPALLKQAVRVDRDATEA